MLFKTKSVLMTKSLCSAAAVSLLFLMYPKLVYAAEARLNIAESSGKGTLSVSRNGIFETDSLIPGDTVDGQLTVSNKTGGTVYYRLKGIYGQPTESELINKAILTISNMDGQVIYKGSFKEAYTPELIINKGKSEKYKYNLHIPIECGNEIISESKNLRFVYLASDRENGTINGDSGGDNGGADGDNGGQNQGGSSGNDQSGSGSGTEERPGQGGSSGSGNSGGSSSGGSHSGGGNSGGSSGGSTGSGSLSGGGNVIGSGFNSGTGNTGHNSSGGYNGSAGYNGSGGFVKGDNTAQAAVYAVPDFNFTKSGYEGSWIQKDGKWYFRLKSGEYIKNGWALLYNPYGKPAAVSTWYYFDKKAVMQTGWIRCENDSWYYTSEVSDGNMGSIVTGWLKNKDDGKTYYLSQLNGRMLTGWNKLKDSTGKEKHFYFAKLEDTYRQNWFFNTSFGRWVYDSLGGRTYGSLFVNERTPDKYYVGEDGARVEK